MTEDTVHLEPLADRGELRRLMAAEWCEPGVVSRGRLWTADDLTAIRAVQRDETVGFAAWRVDGPAWELVCLASLSRGSGIGSRLVDAVVELARRQDAARLRVVTTNDNLDALRFYQRRGFHMVALHAGAIAESRRLKPGIPGIGAHGIPIRDEIELEMAL